MSRDHCDKNKQKKEEKVYFDINTQHRRIPGKYTKCKEEEIHMILIKDTVHNEEITIINLTCQKKIMLK